MKKCVGWWPCALFVLLAASSANAQLFQAPYGPGGTWNLYERGSLGSPTWADALDDALSQTQQGISGNLASIHSLGESFIVQNVGGGGNVWIGLTDREGVATGAFESQGQADNRTMGWAWTSGEPFSFQNWGGGEPNNWDGAAAGTATSGVEDAVHIGGGGTWNDAGIGYGLNVPVVPTIVPGSSGDESGGAQPYVIEYNTAAATPFPGIAIARPGTFPEERLAGPLGVAGGWSVIDYKGTFAATAPAVNVINQILDIQNGDLEADVYAAEVPWLDITDPQTNANGGPTLSNTAGSGLYPYAADTAADDNDIISVAHARIQVTEAGKYTFQVHSDDGFAFRIQGANFESVAGAGTRDGYSPNTILHAADTGDSNTRGVVDLAVGTYDLEFMSWERGGGAFYELTAAKGDFINAAPGTAGQYLAVGDPREVAGFTTKPQAVLNGPLTVANLNDIGDRSLELNREDLLDAVANDSADAMADDIGTFVIDDQNRALGCPFNDFPAFHNSSVAQFPNTVPAGRDNFSTLILGSMSIDDGDDVAGETMEVSIHIDSDDRAMLRIIGQSFEDASNDAYLYDIEGDMTMYADVDTCNTNYTGLITLTEGVEYPFEAVHVEAGGDAGMQVLAAIGDFVNNPMVASQFVALSSVFTDITYPRNIGFNLVAETAGPLGDYNHNGVLDAGDLDLQAAGMATNDLTFDLNGDGNANFDDRLVWVKDLKGTWIGDSDLNGEFNSGDFVAVFTAGKFETNQPANWAEGDWTGDGVFNSSDFVAAFTDGGYEMGPRAAVSSVPEPSSVVLLLIGSLAGLRGVRRRS